MSLARQKWNWFEVARQSPPKRTADDRKQDYHEIYGLFDEQQVKDQASRCIQCGDPLCVKACPLGNRIPEWLELVAEGKFLEAAKISQSTSPIPEICSRICPQDRLCEGACVLDTKSDPVAIGAIEEFINEYSFRHETEIPVSVPLNGFSVAVVGSGPAGLSCADELIKNGFRVTVFESQNRPGGLLLHGIPSFKLDKDVVDRRIRFLQDRGVHFVLNVTVGTDVTLSDLLRDYNAVFLGPGAQKPKRAGVPGESLIGVNQALPFLIQKNVDNSMGFMEIDVTGKNVAVLGGGDTAMDCLRTAIRSGAKEAVCIYRRDLANMPGSRKEYINATEEGARFEFQTNPTEIIPNAMGAVSGVKCQRMQLGPPDASGRQSPVPVPGSEFNISADIVIVAYGFDPFKLMNKQEVEPIKVNKWGGIELDKNMMTSIPGVFAGGDAWRGPSLVAQSAKDGQNAAQGILKFLATK